MKKLLLIGGMIFASFFAANAQSFQLGIKGALNFSKLKSDDGSFLSSSNKLGYQAGVWARIGGLIHLQPELYLTGKTSEASFEENGQTIRSEVSFTNLDLPVLIGTRIGVEGVGIRLQAGPLFSFVVDKSVGEALQQVITPESYKSSNVQFVGGVGLDIGRLRGDLRYETSMSSLTKDSTPDQKVGVFSVGVGYRLF